MSSLDRVVVSVLDVIHLSGRGDVCVFHIPLGSAQSIFCEGTVLENEKGVKYLVKECHPFSNCWNNQQDQVGVVLESPSGVVPKRSEKLFLSE